MGSHGPPSLPTPTVLIRGRRKSYREKKRKIGKLEKRKRRRRKGMKTRGVEKRSETRCVNLKFKTPQM